MLATTGRFQLSPGRTVLTISTPAGRLPGAVGSRAEAVLNQRTDDCMLEMFSAGLRSRWGWNSVPARVPVGLCSDAMEGMWRPWERGWGLQWWTCSSDSASILEAFESAGGSVTGRNVWVAVLGHEQTGVRGWMQQPVWNFPNHVGLGGPLRCNS